MIIFLVAALAMVGLLHFYLWKRLIKDGTRPGPWRRRGTLALVTVGAVLLTGLFGRGTLPFHVEQWVAWPAYIWLGLMFYLLMALLALELPSLVVRLTWVRRADPNANDAGRNAAHPATVPSASSPFVNAAESVGLAPASSDATAPRTVIDRQGGATGPRAEEEPALGDTGLKPDEPGMSRRLLLARSMAATATIVATGTVGYGVIQALGPPRLDRISVPLAKLPRGMDGLRIALVSDIHLGPLRGRSHTQRIVDTINDLDPDLVAVVGDLVDGSVARLGSAAAPLRDLRSRHGSFFVTGNHEYFSGYAEWLDEISELGLRVLQNERVEIDGLDLAGVNDVAGEQYQHGPDHDRALAGRDTTRPVVLLAHQPVQAVEAAKHGVDLQLSGHTHGGQIQPFGAIVRLQQPILSGYGEVNGTKVYVTNGAGFWGPPVRVGAPPQISLVQLRAG